MTKMGFFAEAGPLQVFVSNHLIPEAFEFSSIHEPCYATPDGEQRIAAASDVRLRIVGTRIDANEIVSRWATLVDLCGSDGGAGECHTSDLHVEEPATGFGRRCHRSGSEHEQRYVPKMPLLSVHQAV